MSNFIKVSEYAKQKGITTRTVYRWSQKGVIDVKEINGVLHVKVDDDNENSNDIISTLKSEIRHLHKELELLHERLAQAHEDRQRGDTIIMQLTRQLEQQTLLIEDMRNRSLWLRVKNALGFAS